MVPASFDQANLVLGAPKGMKNCDPLNVYADGAQVVSCWKLTAEELAEVQRTGRVWLVIWGATMPPAYVGGMSPFEPPG